MNKYIKTNNYNKYKKQNKQQLYTSTPHYPQSTSITLVNQSQVCNSFRCRLLEVSDHVIFFFFALEMVIKVMAMGLFGKKAYWSDGWNKLDMFIVLAGLVGGWCGE